MILEFLKQIFGEEHGYKILREEWCCEKLKNDQHYVIHDDECEEDKLGIALHISYYDEDDYPIDEFHFINFCPYCGQPIVSRIVATEDITEIYEKIAAEKEALMQKLRKTDSIKKAQELRCKVMELDDRLDWYSILCNYNDSIKC